jgi:hypothetical protein
MDGGIGGEVDTGPTSTVLRCGVLGGVDAGPVDLGGRNAPLVRFGTGANVQAYSRSNHRIQGL